jgi:hypothetical protein
VTHIKARNAFNVQTLMAMLLVIKFGSKYRTGIRMFLCLHTNSYVCASDAALNMHYSEPVTVLMAKASLDKGVWLKQVPVYYCHARSFALSSGYLTSRYLAS